MLLAAVIIQVIKIPGAKYDPVFDNWIPTSVKKNYTPYERMYHTAVWADNKMIIWGGAGCETKDYNDNCIYWGKLNSGAIYNPEYDLWYSIPIEDAPYSRFGHTAIWTGSEMIVWGGCGGEGYVAYLCYEYYNTGGRYDPLLGYGHWHITTTANAPSPRDSHTSIWTGNEMIIWGGYFFENGWRYYYNTGGKYDPISDSWIETSMTNAPASRRDHTAVWTGSKMIIWGGYCNGFVEWYYNTGSIYDPSINAWEYETSSRGAPSGRTRHTAIWDSDVGVNGMVIWGGYEGWNYLNTGAIYYINSNSWKTMTTMNAPNGSVEHIAIWAGPLMMIWGGLDSIGIYDSGGAYCIP